MTDYFDYEDAILARQEAQEIEEDNGPWWDEQEELSDDLEEFLREIYADTGYDDDEIEEMAREWEEENGESCL